MPNQAYLPAQTKRGREWLRKKQGRVKWLEPRPTVLWVSLALQHLACTSPLSSTLPCQAFFWGLQKTPPLGTPLWQCPRVHATLYLGPVTTLGTEWIVHDH